MSTSGSLSESPGVYFIKSRDLFGSSQSIPIEKLTFRIGVYGILKKDDTVLVQRHPLLEKFGLPGGSVDLGENLDDALIREFDEETGLKISVDSLIHTENTFFSNSNDHYHCINIFYQVSELSGELKSFGNGDDTIEAKFMSMSELNENTIQWAFTSVLKVFQDSLI